MTVGELMDSLAQVDRDLKVVVLKGKPGWGATFEAEYLALGDFEAQSENFNEVVPIKDAQWDDAGQFITYPEDPVVNAVRIR